MTNKYIISNDLDILNEWIEQTKVYANIENGGKLAEPLKHLTDDSWILDFQGAINKNEVGNDLILDYTNSLISNNADKLTKIETEDKFILCCVQYGFVSEEEIATEE